MREPSCSRQTVRQQYHIRNRRSPKVVCFYVMMVVVVVVPVLPHGRCRRCLSLKYMCVYVQFDENSGVRVNHVVGRPISVRREIRCV